VQFFPDNQLGQEIDVVNSVNLGVIDLMVTGTSIWANVVPLIGLLSKPRRLTRGRPDLSSRR
jgi:TRAP-type C4-dicarboxylate transport system substrate-binding protein